MFRPFSELSDSYKTVLVMQMFACYILVGIVGIKFGWLWFAVAFAIDTLKDCFVVTRMVDIAKAQEISEQSQRNRAIQRSLFTETEGRLLSRESDIDAPPTMELPSGKDDWS